MAFGFGGIAAGAANAGNWFNDNRGPSLGQLKPPSGMTADQAHQAIGVGGQNLLQPQVQPSMGRVQDGTAIPQQGPQPWPGQQPQPGMQGAPMMQSPTAQGGYPLAGPNLLAPWTTPFQAPSANDMYKQDPGYQFRMDEGLKGVERSAAARGTLLGGRTMKEMGRYAQNYASSEYDKIYGRAMGEYGMANNIYNQNANNAYSRLFNLAQLGQGAAGQSAQLGQGYGQMAGNVMTDIGNVQAAGQMGSGNAWGSFIGNAANQVAVNQALNRPGLPQQPMPNYMPQYGAQSPAQFGTPHPGGEPQAPPLSLGQPYDPSQDYFGQQQGF